RRRLVAIYLIAVGTEPPCSIEVLVGSEGPSFFLNHHNLPCAFLLGQGSLRSLDEFSEYPFTRKILQSQTPGLDGRIVIGLLDQSPECGCGSVYRLLPLMFFFLGFN